jgi:hypothetical protein
MHIDWAIVLASVIAIGAAGHPQRGWEDAHYAETRPQIERAERARAAVVATEPGPA